MKRLKAKQNNEYIKRKSYSVKEKDVKLLRAETEEILEELEEAGISTQRPTCRAECPNYRPCPFFSCRYHLGGEVRGNTGSITYTFDDQDITELEHSCALDVVEAHPNGLSLADIGEKLNLTRERVRQVTGAAIKNLQDMPE